MRELVDGDDTVLADSAAAIMADFSAWNTLLRKCAVGRKLCTTWMGWIVMAPAGAQVGDAIALLYGAATPMVLREKENPSDPTGGKRSELIGECYVHGLMDGEGINGWKFSEIFRIW